MMKQSIKLIFIICLGLTVNTVMAEENEEPQDISRLTQQERQELGIKTAVVTQRQLTQRLIAPGEVIMNAYRSSQVTTRISAQIIKRHARMGDKVVVGQKLLTLSSVAMAEAQGKLFIADREWRRVKKLGRKVVSEQRYIKAQVSRQQAYARVLAYGMTAAQANNLLLKNNASEATGTFNLLSTQDGTIISDNFITGQVVAAGQVLMEITDEAIIWVESRINPEDVATIKTGSEAEIYVTSEKILTGKVVQIHHRMDEITRTLAVRIAVNNAQQLLHPGQFVKTALYVAEGTEVVAVPTASVVLLQGNAIVFQLLDNKLRPQLVEPGEIRGDWTAIKNGLKADDIVVTQGMFLLKSLLLKSQIGDAD